MCDSDGVRHLHFHAIDNARGDAALEAVRMSTYRDRLSHHLSVGEKNCIAIATVLSMNPKILILDEPTAGLTRAPAGR